MEDMNEPNASVHNCSTGKEGFFHYLVFIYCDFGNHFTGLGLAIYLLYLVTLFLVVATTVDHFFCPSLEVIAKTLRLSQSVAGVTFLAFGNGAPEIFSSIAGASVERPDLVISGLFGSGMFLTCVVAGSIFIMTPFKMVERPFLRDAVFYLAATFWTFVLILHGKISVEHAFSFIGLYVIYTLFVLVVHHIYQTCIKDHPVVDNTVVMQSSSVARISTSPHHSPILKTPDGTLPPIPEVTEVITVEFDEITPWGVPPICKHWDSGEFHVTTDLLDDFGVLMEEDDGTVSPSSGPLTSSVKSVAGRTIFHTANRSGTLDFQDSVTMRLAALSTYKVFLYGVCPVNYHRWHRTTWWNKLLQAIRAPIVLVLKLTVPIVNYRDRHGSWCRPLNALHLITSPLFFLFAMGYGHVSLFEGFQLWTLFLALGGSLACLTLLSTVNSVPPRCHCLFAFLGFLASVTWIYVVATEIVHLLMTFGLVLKLSDNILGLTVLSWGNGIPDYIADVAIAKQGLPQMGISACFGGPLIILFLGFGIPMLAVTLKRPNHVIEVVYTRSSTLFFSFITASLLSSLIVFPLSRFQVSKAYGVYLIALYVVFLVVVILDEFKAF